MSVRNPDESRSLNFRHFHGARSTKRLNYTRPGQEERLAGRAASERVESRAVRVHSPNSASGCDRSYLFVRSISPDPFSLLRIAPLSFSWAPSSFLFLYSVSLLPPLTHLSPSPSLPSPSLSLSLPTVSVAVRLLALLIDSLLPRRCARARPLFPFRSSVYRAGVRERAKLARLDPVRRSVNLRTTFDTRAPFLLLLLLLLLLHILLPPSSFSPSIRDDADLPTGEVPPGERRPGLLLLLCAPGIEEAAGWIRAATRSEFRSPADRGYGFRRCSRGHGTAEATSEQISHKSAEKMQAAPPLLSLLLLLLFATNAQQALGLCNLENGTSAKCHELEDVKYIETYDLESLKSSVDDGVLGPGFFTNLSTLRHLDLSGGNLKRIEPGSFLNLRDLKSLDLSDNRLEYIELAALDGLHQLRTLNLKKNNLRQLPPALVRLKNLRHLDVQGNHFQCNCATLRVRDLLLKRGVKMLKKVTCAGPKNMKGVLILKPEASVICSLEEQDKEMQKDQPQEGSGDDAWDNLTLDEYDDLTEDNEPSEKTTQEHESETPAPEHSHTPETIHSESVGTGAAKVSKSSGEKVSDDDGELFFDTDDRKASSTTEMSKPEVKDALFYPVEGSGDEDEEGSGTEGSGAGFDWPHIHEEAGATSVEPSTTSGPSLFDLFLDVFWSTTAAPEVHKDPDLEEEQFIDASSTKVTPHEETVVTRKISTDESAPRSHSESASTTTGGPGVELVESSEIHDMSKSGKVQVEDDSSDEMASPARQSKKGMGSYVVLAALLAVLAALIGFAAYKGDFCRKKRKRNDVETGTEMKDMQKALLDGSGPQPKIASNGNMENIPLVDADPEEEVKQKSVKDVGDAPKNLNGSSDPVKPPRKSYDQPKYDFEPKTDASSVKDGSLSSRTSPVEAGLPSTETDSGATSKFLDSNGPPLSPGAQRVKITLQENPDSVPRTPILITRPTNGENLVKTP